MNPHSQILSVLGLQPTGDLADLTAYTTARKKVVWFMKSPPKCPWSPQQIRNRNRWKLIADLWSKLTQEKRDAWNLAARRAHLDLHGYHLWVHWNCIQYEPTIRTIEHQSRITLLPT